ncbi:MAG: DNA-directed DNA polymerase II small subunit [Methanobacteriaceae archaeon]|nr:DNA-directed DNA polymerase II small subunit [Methanobacteriaceae archaeon]
MSNIIEKFQNQNILLNHNAYRFIKDESYADTIVDELIEYMESDKEDNYIVTLEMINNYLNFEKKRILETIVENPETKKIRKNMNMPYEIKMDITNQSYTNGDIHDLSEYFNNRYEKLRSILEKKPELRNPMEMKITKSKVDNIRLIGIVDSIQNTKNGHKMIEIEDPTGEGKILIHKDQEDLLNKCKNIVKDEIVGITGNCNGNLVIADDIIQPGIPRNPEKEMDFSIVFLSDVHIGSKMFDEKAFNHFIKWINGNFGNEKQTDLANDVKYLVIGGDLVDGIGIYPNQEKELAIPDIYLQYEEAARLIGDITDIPIIIAPGNHDATRLAEPQPAITEQYAMDLNKQRNVEMVSNPSIVTLDNINVEIYHGRSFDDIIMAMNGLDHSNTDIIMKELMEKRHLAPIYGERTALASEFEDYLVIDEVPDVLHTGHVHINSYIKYKGVHLVNSGTFQRQTEFQKIYNITPTYGHVPVLSRGKMKEMIFT